MYGIIAKWGNSQAIRIPKGLLEVAELHENDRVEIDAGKDYITIKRVANKHKTLEERISEYKGEYKGEYKASEWDTGNSKGKEVL